MRMIEVDNMRANIEKWAGVVYFKDGTSIKSDWFLSDVYVKQWVEKHHVDNPNYDYFQYESATFYEDLETIGGNVPRPHPVNGNFHVVD